MQGTHPIFDFAPNRKHISWLPAQHDMGLVGTILYTLYCGNTAILIPPPVFLEKPVRWLKAISDYQAYMAGGPNFGYQLCIDKVTEEDMVGLDLSSWNVAFNGSEPIRANTLRAFAKKFAAVGFNEKAFLPCYGMAETTLLISGVSHNKTPSMVVLDKKALVEGQFKHQTTSDYWVVSSGNLALGYTLKIVDPDALVLSKPGEIGEIWLAGPCIAQGYWNKKQATEEIFHARLPDDERHYLRTGDLGYLDKEELYVTGRVKDLVILQGRNIYPQDVERVVEACHPAIRSSCTAAFSIDADEQEQLVIVAEVERTYRKIDFKPVFQAIRRAVIDELDAIPFSIQLLSPARALKTTSGKIQRRATKAEYLAGTLTTLASDDLSMMMPDDAITRENIEKDISELLCKILAIDSVDEHKKFSDMGGTSLHATLFQQQLQWYLKNRLELSPSVAFDYPTTHELSAYLYQQLTGEISDQSIIYKDEPAFLHEPIAIIGLSCRFPGGVNDADTFWQLLKEGKDGIDVIPAERWDWRVYEAQTPIKHGAFIDGIDCFDADFFGISPREVEVMDPQQRMLLETSWHALENAGIDPKTLKGSDTSVFIGATTHEYEDLLLQTHEHNSYIATGNTSSVLAGRISYSLGLQGPSLTLDTACSSSLVAIHEACNSLHLNETHMAIVGGVNILLSPDGFINLSKANMLALDGHCKVFSDNADGYVRGEGCGVLVLKKLSDAHKDNNKILALIKSAVINQDGASSGLTVPNGTAQERLLRLALAQAHLQPQDIDYIEAHGTGTKLGDPMETHAIGNVYKHTHSEEKPLIVGSVKANVGHLEAAAGMASIIKVVLSLQQECIPPQIHINKVNSGIHLGNIPAKITQVLMPWSKSNQVRRSGISGFGFSGTNAHVILEEAPYQNENQLRPSLPKTIFKRDRYWAPALEKQCALPNDWFFEKIKTEQILIKDDILAMENMVFIVDKDVIFKPDHVDITFETTDVAAFILQCQAFIKKSPDIKRCIILNKTKENNIHQHVLLNISQIFSWEYDFETIYIELTEDADISAVMNEIQMGHEPVVYLSNIRQVERVIKSNVNLRVSKNLEKDEEGEYLITGGLSGLGFALLKELLNIGIKNIVLCSRRHASEAQQQEINTLNEKFQAHITHQALDISDKKAVAILIEKLPLLQGIFHFVGNEASAAFEEYSQEQIDNAIKPKRAAWHLHELTQDLPLKYFVLFSSIASFFGSNRQGAYVIANGYLDALAHVRQKNALPITHIQWGPWAEVGMAMRDERSALFNQELIPLNKGMQLLKQLLVLPSMVGLGVVSPKYLQFMLSFHRNLPDWMERLFQDEGTRPSGQSYFIKQYYQSEKEKRYALLEVYLDNQFKKILHLDQNKKINTETGFFEMGMDSLTAVELYSCIKKDLGEHLYLRPMLVFDYPSIEKLAHYLQQVLDGLSTQTYIPGHHYEHETIAIIGLEGRFPGGANNVDIFWKNLMDGKDAIRLADPIRWDPEQYSYKAGFIDDIDLFDANFFNISPREAESLDPQQRLLLETTWHALERGGIDPKSIKNTETGVFIGISQSEYGQLLIEEQTERSFYQVTGNALNVAAGRIAYTFGLQGPTMAIDTACSSSLVAVHEACQSLQNHECDMAIVGGVNVLIEPGAFDVLMQGNMLSIDGACKTFDKNANGYARGEGCGVIILKRLSDAKNQSDKIFALIKGSAINQDGASSGLTVPNGLAQEKVIAKALINANVSANSIDYIEAHGTGTALGDPIEIGAIQTIYGEYRTEPLMIGTVKTNIGHLESAAGIAGIIKTILALNHEKIPPHLHFKELNPSIHLDKIPAHIPLSAMNWIKKEGIARRAGVSGFGFSGTNAHIILEEAPSEKNTFIKASLPLTVFHRQRYWTTKKFKQPWAVETNAHPFLQHKMSLPDSDILYFESMIHAQYPEFVPDHLIYGYPVIAGADYISMALSLAREHLGAEYCKLIHIQFIEALVLHNNDKPVSILVKVTSGSSWQQKNIDIYSKTSEQEDAQLRVKMQLEVLSFTENGYHLESIQAKFPKQAFYQGADHLEKAAALSLSLGHHFHWIDMVYTQNNEILAKMRLPNEPVETQNYILYPGLIDACFQSLLALAKTDDDVLAIPFSIDEFVLNFGSIPQWVYGKVRENQENSNMLVDFILFDSFGKQMGTIRGFSAQKAPKEALERSLKRQSKSGNIFYEMNWQPLLQNVDSHHFTGESIYYDARNQIAQIYSRYTKKPH